MERELSDALQAERQGDHGDDATSVIDATIETLHLLAADDHEVLQLIACYGRGLVDRRAILDETGLSATTYHNARRRMLRFVERLPEDLRERAFDAMK